VYPREAARLLGRTPPANGRGASGRDAFDAEVAALAMWRCRNELAMLERSDVMQREGAIWPTVQTGAPTRQNGARIRTRGTTAR
jgi:hypothetical protein